jgi:tubulin epsilon
MFVDAFSKDCQLIRADPKQNLYLACALMVRGADVEISDIRRNIERMKPKLQFIHWNQEGWKVGHCLAPPVGRVFFLSLHCYSSFTLKPLSSIFFFFFNCQKHSLLCLSNNTCIKDTFRDVLERFNKLYKRKAHLFHYEKFMSKDVFEESINIVKDLAERYAAMESLKPSGPTVRKLVPVLG